jgi:hypothetical protein
MRLSKSQDDDIMIESLNDDVGRMNKRRNMDVRLTLPRLVQCNDLIGMMTKDEIADFRPVRGLHWVLPYLLSAPKIRISSFVPASKIMLPKRRFWKDEQKMRRGVVRHFSRAWIVNLGHEPLKSASRIRISSFVPCGKQHFREIPTPDFVRTLRPYPILKIFVCER